MSYGNKLNFTWMETLYAKIIKRNKKKIVIRKAGQLYGNSTKFFSIFN